MARRKRAKRRRVVISRGRGKMKRNECRMTKNKQVYCYGRDGVKFVSKSALGTLGYPMIGSKVADIAKGMAGISRRRGKMKKDECRMTKNGKRYCYKRAKGGGYRVKFMKA